MLKGTNCELKIDLCNPNPCRNMGTCVSNAPGTYYCNCAPKYSGNNCEIEIQVCSSNPCVNGICTEMANRDGRYIYFCNCPAGYTGTRCETQIDVCLSNPCRNGACIQPSPNLWQCQCRPGLFVYHLTSWFFHIFIYFKLPIGFNGLTCDVQINQCNSNPCVNGICTNPFPNMYL